MSSEVSPAREAAAWVLGRCRRFDAWSQQTLDAARSRYHLDERDAALCTRMCMSVLQNAALCDHYIDTASSVPASELEPRVRDVLRLGVVQLLMMDRIPDPAAVSQSVELCKRANPRAAGLVNAVLRKIARCRDTLPEPPDGETAEALSIRYSHPLWLCEKLLAEHGYEHTRAFLETNNREPALSLTANLLRTDAVQLARRLRGEGFSAETSALSPVSVHLTDAGTVTALPGFAEGDFFVQDAAAAMGVLAVAPGKGMRVLDACAAPGGKSLLCASLMGNEGDIAACDIHEKKLAQIVDSARRLHMSIIRTAAMDAADPPPDLENGFDLVMADVPCSGMGVIRKKPEIRYKDPDALRRLPEVQLRILRGVSRCVRPGGTLLYSTCTVFREENEDVVGAFLEENGDFRMEECRTIWPQEYDTDGFFYSILRKNEHCQ